MDDSSVPSAAQSPPAQSPPARRHPGPVPLGWLLFVGWIIVNVSVSSLLGDHVDWGSAMVVGTLFASVPSAFAWMAWGPGNFSARLLRMWLIPVGTCFAPFALLSLIAFVMGEFRESVLEAGCRIAKGVSFLVWFGMLPFAILRVLFGWRFVTAQSQDTWRNGNQTGVRDLLFLTFGTAVSVGLTRDWESCKAAMVGWWIAVPGFCFAVQQMLRGQRLRFRWIAPGVLCLLPILSLQFDGSQMRFVLPIALGYAQATLFLVWTLAKSGVRLGPTSGNW